MKNPTFKKDDCHKVMKKGFLFAQKLGTRGGLSLPYFLRWQEEKRIKVFFIL